MRFAIDFDGTIADTNRAKAAWALEHLGTVIAPWDCDRTSCLPIIGPDAYARMADCVFERESTMRTDPVPGAAEALRWLSERGEVHVVTARQPERMAYARQWCEDRRLLHLVARFSSSKGTTKEAICRALEASVLVDDDLRHLREVQLVGLTRIWLQAGRVGPPAEPIAGVAACRSWPEALDVLSAALATNPASRPPGA